MTLPKRLALLCAVVSGLSAQVRINEVLFYPDAGNDDPLKTHQWVELFNSGTDPVDLTGWSVTDASGIGGARARALPPATLPAGAYLVVHFASGPTQLDFSGGSGDYYTGDSTDTPYWSVDSGEAALYSPAGITDFINWARSGVNYQPGAAHNDAVAAQIWTSGAVLLHDRIGIERMQMLRFVAMGDSLGRDANSTDTDTISDFDALGGPSGLGPTPGRQNLTPGPITDATADLTAQARPKTGAAAGGKKWTVILFMSSDNNLEGWFFKKLLRVQQAGGSGPDVNFVAMWDPKTMYTTTYRGLVGPPRNDSQLGLIPPAGENIDIGERDMGDPQELQSFIAWAKQNYPADHYALVLSSHGDGWKGFGPDETFPAGTREKNDTLFMGELSTALAGQNFEWIAFDACLMAAVEVAHQIQPFAHYLLSSEEVTYATDFPYEQMAAHLTANPGWTGDQFIDDIFKEYVPRAQANSAQQYEISVMDLTRLPDLVVNLRSWADLLAPGMSLFQKRDDPSDNVQVLTMNQINVVENFTDKNFIDLYHFASLMQKSGVPNCLLTPVASILDIIQNRVIRSESHGGGHPNAHGIHIYWPRRRMIAITNDLFPDFFNQPYDLPYTRTFDGSTPLAHYGVRQDALPLQTLDPETGKDFDLLNVWPLPQSPGFKFPNDTGWHKVLDRYYHPAADNHILKGVTPDGQTILPIQTGGGACLNPSDQISVPVGSMVFFSGMGSSDADQVSGVNPTYYFWDKDSNVGCTDQCIQPFEVPPGSDAGLASNDNIDADQDIVNTTFDEKDASGPTFSRACLAPGSFNVTLIPWDDDHLFAFHNTLPNARYVHPQTRDHQASVSCRAAPPPPTYTCPMSGRLYLNFTVLTDPFISAFYVALMQGNLTMTRSGMQVSVTGDRPQLVPASGPFDAASCSFKIDGVATGPIAGFNNVGAEYNLKIGGTKFDMVTGTYKVGTNGNLNGEPQPVTYNVTGTVTNAQ